MGRYSSDSEDDRRRKKKKKHRSRSRSRSSSYSSYTKKKSKKKSRKRSPVSRSRSRSSEYRRRRSRSRSSEKSSRHHKSRSKRRSRSRDRHSSSRTQRRRSRSRSGSRSRCSSRDRKDRKLNSPSPSEVRVKDEKNDPARSVPGFDDLSLSEQNELRMQMALKAAAATDERLRQEGVLPSNVGRSTLEEQMRRQQEIEDIEADAFVQRGFSSNRAEKPSVSEASSAATHENAIFSNVPLSLGPVNKMSTVNYNDPDALMHPNLYESQDVKMERWVTKLAAMRRRKLEGEAMH